VADNSKEQTIRNLQAVILCVLATLIYAQFVLIPKKKAALEQQHAAQNVAVAPGATAVGTGVSAVPAPVTPSQPATPPSSHPTKDEIAQRGASIVDLGKTQVSISTLGARLVHYKLMDYKSQLGADEPLDLVDAHDGSPLPLGIYVGSESDERVSYSLIAVNGAPAGGQAVNLKAQDGATVTLDFKGTLPSGIGITKSLSFTGGAYLFSVHVALERPAPAGQAVWLEWPHYFPSDVEKQLRIKHTLTYLEANDKVRHVQLDQIAQGLQDYGTSKWVSIGDTYFTSAIIPTVSTPNTLLGREGDLFVGRVAGSTTEGRFYSYVGPKDYKTLEAAGAFNLERTIDLGWFSFLALPLLWLLQTLYGFFGNYGVAIIALTLIVKALMLPLSKASFESAKKMQEIAPEIKALRERIKDPNQLNQETFALYKRRGVNPMGGCLPIAIQIPVFLGLYNALLSAIELRHAPFALWINDLSAPEHLQVLGIGVPVMVLLMAASMVYQQWTTPNPSADPTQQKMMMIMPVVFAGMFIIFPMPAGLVLYWLVNNIISITQQLYMRSSDKGSVYIGTLVASVIIFGVGFVLTLI